MRFLLSLFLITFAFSAKGNSMASSPSQEVAATLDQFHQAAAQHDFAKYFSLMTNDAVFIGTDASERWDVPAFKAYVKPRFDKGQGWTYRPQERHISFSPAQDVAWFDEMLDHAKYGRCRGTGVLIKDAQSKTWKISQYHLTMPVPNELVEDFIKMVQGARSK